MTVAGLLQCFCETLALFFQYIFCKCDIFADCDVNCHKKCEKLMPHLCGVNQKLVVEALTSLKKGRTWAPFFIVAFRLLQMVPIVNIFSSFVIPVTLCDVLVCLWKWISKTRYSNDLHFYTRFSFVFFFLFLTQQSHLRKVKRHPFLHEFLLVESVFFEEFWINSIKSFKAEKDTFFDVIKFNPVIPSSYTCK